LSDYIQNVEVDAATGEVTYAVVNDNYRLLTLADVVYDSTEAVTAGDIDFIQGTAGGDNGNVDYIAAQSQSKLYDASGNLISGIALSKYFDDDGNYIGGLFKDSQATDKVETNADIKDYITKSQREVLGDLTFSLHVGADSDRSNKIYTTIETMSAAGLGLTKLKSSSVGIVDETGDNATDAIDIISEAIQRVSTQRSALGAVQNRLEHTIKNLDNVVENTTAAESQIRDTDMATEMVQYSNANILAQAGQAMLAQANQSNQGVLSLLS
jgi:flagellin